MSFDFTGGKANREELKKTGFDFTTSSKKTAPTYKKLTPDMANYHNMDMQITGEPEVGPARRLAGAAGLGLGRGATQIGALATDLVLQPHDAIVSLLGGPEYEPFKRSKGHEKLFNETTKPIRDAIGLKGTTAENVAGEIAEFIPSLAISGGITRAAGLAPKIEKAGTAIEKALGGKTIGKVAGGATKTTPDMVNTWMMMEAPKPEGERIPFPEWAAYWAGGEGVMRLGGTGLKAGSKALGKGASRAVDKLKKPETNVELREAKPFRPFESGLTEAPIAEKPIGIEQKNTTLPKNNRYWQLVAGEIERLKSESGQGVMQSGLGRDSEGSVVTAWGRKSLNPKWYQDLYKSNASEKYPAGRKPTVEQYKKLAIKNLQNGTEHFDGTPIPANTEFLRLEKELQLNRPIKTEWENLEKVIQEINANKEYSYVEKDQAIAELRAEQEKLLQPEYQIGLQDNFHLGKGVTRSKTPEIKVYRGYASGENAKDANLTRMQTFDEVLSKTKGEKPKAKYKPLDVEYYTESSDVAKLYASQDEQDVIGIMEATGKNRQEAEKTFETLVGRKPTGEGNVKEYSISPTKVLDLSELGETPKWNDVINDLLKAEGSPIPKYTKGENINAPKWKRFNDIERQFVVNKTTDESDILEPWKLLRSYRENDASAHEFVEWMQKNGYDAMRYAENGTNHYAILPKTNEAQPLGKGVTRNTSLESPQTSGIKPGNAIAPENLGKPFKGQELGRGAKRIEVPEKMETLGNGQKVRSLGVTSAGSDWVSPEMQKGLINEMAPGKRGAYDAITNKETIAQAEKLIAEDIEAARRLVREEPGNALSNTVALRLVQKANTEGKYDEAIDILEGISQKSTTQGQAIQSLSLWGKMTPEGMLKYTQKTIDRANDALKKAGRKGDLKLAPDVAEKVAKEMKRIETMPEGREKLVATKQLLNYIDGQVPSSFLKKVSTVHTMGQLLNPKTAMRNIIGNTGFAAGEVASDVVGVGVDKMVSKFTGQRSKLIPSFNAQTSGFKQGLREGYEDAIRGIDTGPAAMNKFELSRQPTFKSDADSVIERGLAKAEKALGVELRATDRAFFEAAYEDAMRQEIKLAEMNGRELDAEAAEEIATYTGLYRTFQDDNALSNLFSGLKRLLNMDKEFGAGDFIIKYPKTPANLINRGFAYSPAGFARTIFEASKPLMGVKFNQKAFVESFSRALVGSTSLAGTGAVLHKLGILSGKPSSDWDIEKLNKQAGLGAYKINASGLKRFVLSGFDPEKAKVQKNDMLVTYDWFQPFALPIMLGAEIDNNATDAMGLLGTMAMAFGEGVNAFAEQPLMQGVETLMGGGGLGTGIINVLKGVLSSFVPTILNQTKQSTDEAARSSYDPNWGKQMVNRAVGRIPGVSYSLPQQYDTLGKPRTTYQNEDIWSSNKNPLNVYLMPSFQSRYNPTPEAQMVIEVFNNTGETKHVPRSVRKYFTVSGQKVVLTADEYVEMQRVMGEETMKGFGRISPHLSDEEKIKRMMSVLTDAGRMGKDYVLENRGIRYNAKSGKVHPRDMDVLRSQ